MAARIGETGFRHPAWWTLMLIVSVVGFVALSSALFSGTFTSHVPVTLTSDRAGLVMESGAKVRLRGIPVGRVSGVAGGGRQVSLQLEIDPDQIQYIPANVEAEIKATTAFGAKYVDLIYPDNPSSKRLTAGEVLRSRNVSTEVNTVFENLVGMLHQIDPAKLNAVLGAIAEGVGGQGERMGQATTDANQVLLAINPRMDAVRRDIVAFKGFSDTYGAAALDILTVLNAASTTSATITDHASDLDALLLSTIGFANSGVTLVAPNKDNLIRSVNLLEPTTNLLMTYNPAYTCLLVGGKKFLDDGGYAATGGANGYSTILDAGVLWGNDQYRYPDNLPVIAAKGGPGGKPGCGALPDVSKNYPLRYLVTNTGWGTGLDVRPNPGIGHPWWVDYFPVTRAVPEPPSTRGMGPPAIGPIPYPGAPPYGAPLYGPGGIPLYPGVPPPNPAPSPTP
ncbi:MCE family protein [Mycobacterium sp. CVI_P3]|uniref:MCE family protein n=1 Tax=Mycobacterium pinniadriaticum TaxID=2994102 RepID=A0ABT3SGW6_9MYCO|nr:MCE family protein [Mycobacterium pinniadriaticum]MCX2932410.1 MCE family protein [Mycobacterium pinniadriaticum]MCX2938733.1 MCE family protein [Mycobacterium pinniadriaticum]